MNYPHVRNALLGQPWAIREAMLDAIIEIVDRKAGALETPELFATMTREDQRKWRAQWPKHEPVGQLASAASDGQDADRGWQIMDNIAIVPIVGPIMRRANLFTQMSGATSIDLLTAAFREALTSSAPTILLHVDSPGGTVLGVPELASEIYDARQNSGKLILALADGLCASAACWLASQANYIFTTEASMTGSIGVIARIQSSDRAALNQGIDSLVVRSSELKGIGAGPVTPNQESAIRQQVMQIMGMFKAAVVRGRQQIDIESVANGLEYIGQNAVDAGLCDEVSDLPKILQKYGKL